MYWTISASADLPIYRQIMRHVMDSIAGGHLNVGDRLPSHRELSVQLVIAPLTVKKAYDELEALGYVETVRGRGTFVCARPPVISSKVRTAALLDAAKTLLSQAYLAGVSLPEVLALVKAADELLLTPTTRSARAKQK